MDISLVKEYAAVASIALSIGAMVYAWLTSRSKANTAALKEHETRLIKIEAELKHAPQHSDFARIYERLDHMNGEVSAMRGSMEVSNRQLAQVLDYLMQSGNK